MVMGLDSCGWLQYGQEDTMIKADEPTKLAEAKWKNEALPAHCEKCGLGFDIDEDECPKTADPFTCDDCGGAVE